MEWQGLVASVLLASSKFNDNHPVGKEFCSPFSQVEKRRLPSQWGVYSAKVTELIWQRASGLNSLMFPTPGVGVLLPPLGFVAAWGGREGGREGKLSSGNRLGGKGIIPGWLKKKRVGATVVRARNQLFNSC